MTDLNNNELREQYRKVLAHKESFKEKIEPILQDLIEKSHIKTNQIISRVKDKESFVEKVRRKEIAGDPYENPLEEMDDIVGFRIVPYYQKNLETICKIIDDNFYVISTENKRVNIPTNEFGYIDICKIVKISDVLANDDLFLAYKDYKFELQIRTVLQDAWSVLSHEIGYKKRKNLPHKYERELNALSASLEIIDEKISALRHSLQDTKTEDYFNEKQKIEPITTSMLNEYFVQSEQIRKIQEHSQNIELRLTGKFRSNYLEALRKEFAQNDAKTILEIDQFIKENLEKLYHAIEAWKNASQRKQHPQDAILYIAIILITKSKEDIQKAEKGWGQPWAKYALDAWAYLYNN